MPNPTIYDQVTKAVVKMLETAGTDWHQPWQVNGSRNVVTDSGQSLGTSDSTGAELGDVDDDGDLDAFVADGGWLGNQPGKVWLNDGNGTFTDSGQALGSSPEV